MTKRYSIYHLKTGRIGPVFEWYTRLDKMAFFCLSHSKTGQIGPVFKWSTSLDHFIIEKCHKKNIFYNKTV